ncbi:aminoacyl-tRNA hydrolase [Candidatus Phytoplasma oryzae]|nr:aminoacyl-tRNA hydrolase [Candidatus Phytoplasma oryzae]
MKLIVGLGNIGEKYKYTPHNIGFLMIDYFLKKIKDNNIIFCQKKEFNFFYFIEINKKKTILFKPQNYMNSSGIEIKKIISNHKINLEDILILNDDIYLKIGKFKFKKKGNHGGHKGLKNIIDNLKTNIFKRLKIGVDYDNKMKIEKYVLNPLSKEQIEKIMINFDFFYKILISFVNDISLDKIMSTAMNTNTTK